MSVTAYIAIGSNQDGPVGQVRRAIEALDHLPESACTAVSALSRNPPMGPTDQPDYVNAVAALRTALAPFKLLAALQQLEAAAGRQRSGRRWGPRPLDLDILLYGEQRIEAETLEVPHPGLAERAFVVVPLADIAPAITIPGQGPLPALLAGIDASGLVALGSGEIHEADPPPGMRSAEPDGALR